MAPSSWDRLQELFQKTLEQPLDKRRQFLLEQCGDHNELFHEVWSLIEADATDYDPVIGSAFDMLATGVAEEGVMFGPYRILKKIGSGGMGTVFLAERADGSFDQNVAIKVVKKGMDTEAVVERFRLERQLLARLRHPNIARLLDGGVTEDGRPFFVMEHVVGLPITEYCDNSQLSVDERLDLFISVCRAVHHAHQNLIVHRDIKPSNILVNADGEIKLLDFGIAKLLDETEDPALTRTGQRVLTPAYASPEQLTSSTITTASDVYALGIILYELLSGRRPFEVERTGSEFRELILSSDPLRPSTAVLKPHVPADLNDEPATPDTISATRSTRIDRLRKKLSGDLDRICLMALRKEPERRYTSAEEFASDIVRHQNGFTVYAQPDSFSYRTQKFVTRHRAGVITTAAVVVLFLSLIAFYTDRLADERDRAIEEQAKTSEVVGFVTGLFEYADPENARGREITVSEILDDGARGLEDLSGRPGVQSTMQRVLGEVYYSIGDLEKADSLIGDALRRQESLPDVSPLERARSEIALGIVRQDQSNLDAADSLFLSSMRRRIQSVGRQHPDVAESISALAFLYETRGKYAAAESLYIDALRLNRALAGSEPDTRVAESLKNLAGLYRLQDRPVDAEVHLRDALALQLQLYDGEHLETAQTQRHLASVLRDTGRYPEAESLYLEVIDTRTRMLGENNLEVANVWNSYGNMLSQKGDLDGAIEANQKMISILNAVIDGPHPHFAAAYNNLALLLRDSGDDLGAIEYFGRSIAMQDAVGLDPRHPNRAFPLVGLAESHRMRGNNSEAIRILRDILELRREVLTSDHRHTMDTASDLAINLVETGQYTEAEALLMEAYAYFHQMRGTDDVRTQRTARRLITLYTEMDQPEKVSEYEALLVDK